MTDYDAACRTLRRQAAVCDSRLRPFVKIVARNCEILASDASRVLDSQKEAVREVEELRALGISDLEAA